MAIPWSLFPVGKESVEMGQNIAMTPDALPLHDIHLPAPIGWWPPAPGWWILSGLLLLVPLLVWGWWRFRQRRRMRQLALQQLEKLTDFPETELLIALSRLLRQAAIIHFPRQDCAGLSGQDWLEFLDRSLNDRPFSTGIGRCLSDAPYRPGTEVDTVALLDLCRRWLKKLPPQNLQSGRGR